MATNNLGQTVNSQGMTVAQMVAAGQASTAAALAGNSTATSSDPTAGVSSPAADPLEGLISPMSLGDIRNSEEFRTGEEALRAGADAGFDPGILRAKTEGRGQISTAEGITGQRAGFNVSSAEMSFIASTQDKVAGAIKDIQQQKQAYIDQGLMDLATQLEDREFKLITANNDLTLRRADLALRQSGQDIQEEQFQQQFGLSQEQFEQNKTEFASNLALSVANLLGEFEDGTPTFAAQQADIQNAFDEANLTGYYNGTETLDSFLRNAQLELQKRGVIIDEARLEETIKANRVQEGLSRARLAGDGTETVETPSSVINDTVSRLTTLRDSGELTDLNYQAELSVLAKQLGYDASTIGVLESLVNSSMQGDAAAQQMLQAQAEQEMGSDFSSTPGRTVATKIGDTLGNIVDKTVNILPNTIDRLFVDKS